MGHNMSRQKKNVKKKKMRFLVLLTAFLAVFTLILVVRNLPSRKDEAHSLETTSSGESFPSEEVSSVTRESPVPSESAGSEEETEKIEAVYLGVLNYGAPETKKENAEQFRYRFREDGEEKVYAIDNSPSDSQGAPVYPVQNKLKEGYSFQVTLKDGVIMDVTETFREPPVSFTPVVQGKPGEKTVMNFIRTSLMPVGTTLYVFGGGWDWQDTGSAIQARTIGVSPDWVRFFNAQDANYTFRDQDNDESKRDPTTSYYPFGGYNEYYYAGLDCSGYVGWAVYNTFETEDGKDGYVGSSTKMAGRFSEYGWGALSKPSIGSGEKENRLKPGDIISIKGHVWISLGTCSDGSVLIVHSSNGFISRTGQPGGGVALAAVGNSKECEAYRLADEYMSKYYPEWYSRYTVPLSSPDKFFNFDAEDTGRLSWDTASGKGLTDDLGAQEMTPDQILKYCYGEV